MAERLLSAGPNWLLPAVLSTTAGAVDVIGFLGLGGLLTAHITGTSTGSDMGALINTATVNANNEPVNEQNDQSSATINISTPDVDVTKTADSAIVNAGGTAGECLKGSRMSGWRRPPYRSSPGTGTETGATGACWDTSGTPAGGTTRVICASG